jgi:hypothetical protein
MNNAGLSKKNRWHDSAGSENFDTRFQYLDHINLYPEKTTAKGHGLIHD